MIVLEPPFEMVALFADLDTQKLFEVLIERGQAEGRRCSTEFRWKSVRDPRRDTIWQRPETLVWPIASPNLRYLIVWDQHGSGAEHESVEEIERKVVERLAVSGVRPSDVLAVILKPELEVVFAPVWDRVKQIVGTQRGRLPPSDEQIVAEARKRNAGVPNDFEAALRRFPKEIFGALSSLMQLRRAAPLYTKVAENLSLRRLKEGDAVNRIAFTISGWFPF